MKGIIGVVTLLLAYSVSYAQTLTLDTAINIALRNNLDIELARNILEASQINNAGGVALALPQVTASVTDNQSVTNLRQELNTGTKISRSGNANNALNAGVTGTALVFNGFRIQATRSRLAALERQNEQQLRAQIQNIVSNVVVKYYDVIRQQNYIKTVQQSLAVTQEQKKIIDARKSVGLANNVDVYQAQLDLNAALQEIQAQQLILDQSKSDLMNLLAQRPDSSFSISDTIVVDTTITLDTVRAAISRNPELISAEEQIRINEFVVREVAAQRYPSVTVSGGYNYARSKSGAGNVLLNQSNGPFLGFGVAVPIFNGGLYRRQQRVAEIDIRNAELSRNILVNNIETSAIKSWQAYRSNLQSLRTERQNISTAYNLLQLTLQRYQYNVATIIEVREAQRSFVDAGFRLVNLAYAAKVAEVELKRIMNKLPL